jgi:hypothetical protein
MDRVKDGYQKNSWIKRINLVGSPRLLPILFLFLFCLSGCASIAISALGAGAGLGIPYVFNNCADRTVNFPLEQVNRVTPAVLKKMDIVVHARTWTESGETILASAEEVDILIEMQRVTNKTTRITVDAKKSQFVRDKATAEEIINQLERTLARK